MSQKKAYDISGKEIQKDDLVRVMHRARHNNHPWLKPGNTLLVSYWEDRMGMMVIFLKSKTGNRLCQRGMEDKFLKIIARKGEY